MRAAEPSDPRHARLRPEARAKKGPSSPSSVAHPPSLFFLFPTLIPLLSRPPLKNNPQHEKAFQKQHGVNLLAKGKGKKGTKPGKAGTRFHRSVGLGFKTPKEAIEGTYIDKKCPFTGNVSIRGRILTGTVHSTKMHRTLVVRRDYMHFIKKYSRYEKRHGNISAHISPAFRAREGDTVVIGQCRPLSKTVRFNVLRVIPAGGAGKKGFTGF